MKNLPVWHMLLPADAENFTKAQDVEVVQLLDGDAPLLPYPLTITLTSRAWERPVRLVLLTRCSIESRHSGWLGRFCKGLGKVIEISNLLGSISSLGVWFTVSISKKITLNRSPSTLHR